MPAPADAHGIRDDTPRVAVVSAFAPELALLQEATEGASTQTLNGASFTTGTLEGHEVVLFLSGISVVNAAMTVQLALDHFAVERIVFSGIAGGVDPALNVGDVVVADRWGQYLEMLYARTAYGGWTTMPFFEYPFENFGMMFPRSVSVLRAGADEPETRFWFPADEALLAGARRAADDVTLARCTAEDACLSEAPRIVVGGSGVSGSAFVDNAAFRTWTFAPSARACWTWKAPPWRTWPMPTACPSSPSAASPTWRAAARAKTRSRSSWASRPTTRQPSSRRC